MTVHACQPTMYSWTAGALPYIFEALVDLHFCVDLLTEARDALRSDTDQDLGPKGPTVKIEGISTPNLLVNWNYDPGWLAASLVWTSSNVALPKVTDISLGITDGNQTLLAAIGVVVVDGGVSDCSLNGTLYTGSQPSLQSEGATQLTHVKPC